jgi:hypothetical protein
MRTLVLKEVSVDQGHNPLAQRLILCEVRCIEDLEPDFQIRVANENSRIRLVAVSRLSRNQPSSGFGASGWRPEFRLSTMYLARRSLILVPSSSPKMIRGSP